MLQDKLFVVSIKSPHLGITYCVFRTSNFLHNKTNFFLTYKIKDVNLNFRILSKNIQLLKHLQTHSRKERQSNNIILYLAYLSHKIAMTTVLNICEQRKYFS